MFTVESNGDVRCALCDWTAPERASTAMQNDLSTWKRLFPSLKTHCGQTPSSLSKPAVKRHVERVLAIAAEPAPPTVTTYANEETPEPRRPSKRPRGAPPVHAAAALDAEPPQAASDAVVPAKKAQGRPRKVQAPPPPPPPPTAGYDWIVVGAKVQTVEGAYGESVRGVVTEMGTGWVTVLSTEGYEVKSRRTWLAPATLTDEEAARCARGPRQPAEWLQARIDGSICVRYDQREFKNRFSTTDGRVIRQFVVDSGTTNVRCALCDWTPPQDQLGSLSGSGWLANRAAVADFKAWFFSRRPTIDVLGMHLMGVAADVLISCKPAGLMSALFRYGTTDGFARASASWLGFDASARWPTLQPPLLWLAYPRDHTAGVSLDAARAEFAAVKAAQGPASRSKFVEVSVTGDEAHCRMCEAPDEYVGELMAFVRGVAADSKT